MSNSSKKAIKYTVNRISSGISSPVIVDQNEFKNQGLIGKVKNEIKTRMVCNTTQSVFIDFKRSTFPEVAKDKYYDILQAYKRKDKVDLMKYLSIPLYDLVKANLKNGTPLPFKFYDEIVMVNLLQARVFSLHKHGNNPAETWHQMTCRYIFYDKENKKEITQYNVLERREVDKEGMTWRMCHIDN
ncbi:hypothetical protein PPERSA_13068 [Pseudocohnilembus persalinus]|uniref:Tim44-like domain-containing protein n=1 Tax=Pseudocohnilembus persalinus TaxID=266149 RepID=A0A0V0QWX5_PSEPJ|nr:hypothetical protein PPERSA_13068 [Pseudocohnilembus persalinus]|eukprot:KRX06589.1 hypothetical protein PPERSA_13068 [Pseudocohnilembus persalinus]